MMANPAVTVKIAFDLNAAGQGDFLTLNDPVKGELGNASYPLAGDVLTDVTADVRSVRIRRGRSNELDRFQAGSIDVVLDNRQRLYDPTAGTAVSPYGVSLKPRKEITVALDGEAAFVGQVDDWDLEYQLSGDSVTKAKGADGFAILSQQTISPHTTSAETTGERVAAILDRGEINWPSALRDIDTGEATLIADSVGGTANPAPVNALQYLQRVERDEPGALYVDRSGFLTFRSRTDVQTITSTKFADDGTGIPFSNIGVEYGTEQLRNAVSVARVNAGTATAADLDSLTDYGVISYEQRDSLLDSDAQAQSLADWLVNLYGQPQLRIREVAFDLIGLTDDQVTELLTLDLGDAVQVVFTPNSIGSPISRYVAVDSIEHDITPGTHRMKVGLSQTIGAFILDSPVFGELDDDILGF